MTWIRHNLGTIGIGARAASVTWRGLLGAAAFLVVTLGLCLLVLLAASPVWPAAERMARQGGVAKTTTPTGVLAGTLGAGMLLVLAGYVREARR